MDARVLVRKARMLLRQWPVVWAANLLLISTCAVVLAPAYGPAATAGWAATNYLLFLIRVREWWRFGRLDPSDAAALAAWLREYAAYAVIGGLIWGTGAFAFLDARAPDQMVFLLVAVLGVCAGGLPALSSHFPAYCGFAVPMLSLIALKLALLDGQYTLTLSVLALVYLVVSLLFSRNLSRTIAAAINSDLENERLLAEVTRGKEIAERANREKSQFLAAASHDVRQPLHAAGFFLESLGQRIENDEQRKLYGQLNASLQSLEDLFASLLEISRLDAGAVKPEIATFPLDPLIRTTADEFTRDLALKGLTFEYTPVPALVRSDPVLLSNVLRNLLGNAVKYTTSGTVRVSVATTAENCTIAVEDTGQGIAREALNEIFQPFAQLHPPAKSDVQGFGLGLSVVEKTLTLLNHAIAVTSHPGQGSRFEITLSRGTADELRRDTEPARRADLTGVHVVLIDNEEAILKGMTTLLADWGCNVTPALSGATALVRLAELAQPPDIVICDYRLDDGADGFDAIAELRTSIDPELPAALMSGDTDPALLERAADAELHLLHKPIKPSHLMKVIVELI